MPEPSERGLLHGLPGLAGRRVAPGDADPVRVVRARQRRVARAEDLIQHHRVARGEVLRAHLGRIGRVLLSIELLDAEVRRQRQLDPHVARGDEERLGEPVDEDAPRLVGAVEIDIRAAAGVGDHVHERVVHAVADADADEVDAFSVRVLGVLPDEHFLGHPGVGLSIADQHDAVDAARGPVRVGERVARGEAAVQIGASVGLDRARDAEHDGVVGARDDVAFEHGALPRIPRDGVHDVALDERRRDGPDSSPLELDRLSRHRSRRVEHERDRHGLSRGGRPARLHRIWSARSPVSTQEPSCDTIGRALPARPERTSTGSN